MPSTQSIDNKGFYGWNGLKHPSRLKPLVVKPRSACLLLDCGMTYLYDLINAGEIDSFKDGKSRKITTASIKAYIARRLEASKEASA